MTHRLVRDDKENEPAKKQDRPYVIVAVHANILDRFVFDHFMAGYGVDLLDCVPSTKFIVRVTEPKGEADE